MFVKNSPRCLSLSQAAALSLYARRFSLIRVGVFSDPSLQTLHNTLKSVPLDIIQLHGNEKPETCALIEKTFAIPVIKALGIKYPHDVKHAHIYTHTSSFLLFDSKPLPHHRHKGGHGRAFNWKLLRLYRRHTPAFLAGGLNPLNVSRAVKTNTSLSLDVSSGIEYPKSSEKAYTKNPLAMNQFMRAVRLSTPA
jgi:phosphoribosylanthranilate isomerase